MLRHNYCRVAAFFGIVLRLKAFETYSIKTCSNVLHFPLPMSSRMSFIFNKHFMIEFETVDQLPNIAAILLHTMVFHARV